MKKKNEDEGNLATLVRAELAAVETYKQALKKVAAKEAVVPELRRISAEHAEALSVLQEHMTEENEEAPADSGLWGEWSKAIEGAAAVLGDKAAIKALKHGEEHGVHSYESALRNEGLDAEIRKIISSQLLPQSKAHIPDLDRLLAKTSK